MITKGLPGRLLLAALCSVGLASTTLAATKWDMPTPYGDGVHHTRNVKQFASDVEQATQGALKIQVHSGASLFKHPEIHRAVRTGQVPIGEMFMGLLGNQNPVFKADNIPFLASDFDSAKKLWDASRPYVEIEPGEGWSEAAVRSALATPGLLHQEAGYLGQGFQRDEDARLQPDHVTFGGAVGGLPHHCADT